MKKIFLSLGFSTLSLCVLAATYTVKPNDTFSGIALKNFGPPVYTKQGAIRQLQRLNPQVKNVDLIYPGQALNLIGQEFEAPVQIVSNTPTVFEIKKSESSYNEEAPSPKAKGSFEVAGLFDNWKITNSAKRTSSQGTLYSDHIFGVALRYKRLHENKGLEAEIALLSLTFDSPSGRNLKESKLYLFEGKLQGSLNWSSWTGGAELMLLERPFIKDVSQQSLTIDSFLIPAVGLFISKDMRPFRLGLAAGYLNNSSDAQAGLYYRSWGRYTFTNQVSFQASAGQENQSSKMTERTVTSLRFEIMKEF